LINDVLDLSKIEAGREDLLTPRKPSTVTDVVTSPDRLAEDVHRRRPDLTPEAVRDLRDRYATRMRAAPNLVDTMHAVAGVSLYEQFRSGDIRAFGPDHLSLIEPGRFRIPGIIRDLIEAVRY
jgi:hypothetical protein